jgi:hypothetical protein
MTTTTQTPGPWHYSAAVGCVFGPVGTCPQVCSLPAFGGAEGTANGRLLAAAPELLAALRVFLLARSGHSPFYTMDEAEHKARAAIAKAEGTP